MPDNVLLLYKVLKEYIYIYINTYIYIYRERGIENSFQDISLELGVSLIAVRFLTRGWYFEHSARQSTRIRLLIVFDGFHVVARL